MYLHISQNIVAILETLHEKSVAKLDILTLIKLLI